MNNLYPKKHLGQHFLVNPKSRQRIIDACQLTNKDTVLEIGPGQGAITFDLIEKAGRVIAVEKDQRCAVYLKSNLASERIDVIQADILKYSFHKLPEKTKIVGNLPYNIATPIIEKIIANREKFTDIFITVQQEYGRRLLAQPHSREYGSLSCFVQYYLKGKMLFKISPAAFRPQPKVQSCFMHFTVRKKDKTKVKNEEYLFNLIKQAFSQRRKMITNALSDYDQKLLIKALRKSRINPSHRAENISLRQYIQLAQTLSG